VTVERADDRRDGRIEKNGCFMKQRHEKSTPSVGRANLARLRQATEGEIMRTSPPELAELPADFWDHASLMVPVRKQAISLRVDEDVLEWFKQAGPRYQSRMNAVLRSFMQASTGSPRKAGKR
jgi:uncharacterized protein (DUF4415 family)